MAIRTSYEHGQFCWIDLAARDMEAAREFYHQLFGWESPDGETQGTSYLHFALDGKRVAGMRGMSAEMLNQDQPSCWNSYINVDDISAACARVSELGGKVVEPEVEVPGAGTRALIQDPTGGQVGLWRKGSHFGAELTQDFHCCCWNELMTRDIETARDFYGRLFNWEFADYTSTDAKYYVVSHAGEESSGLLEMDARWGDMPARWMVYFAVQGVDLTVDFVRQLGGFVLVHPFDIPEGRFAMVTDDQGGAFDLVEMSDEPEEDAG
ncbi:MAG: VOC family protein [Pirellulaceae bacterium]